VILQEPLKHIGQLSAIDCACSKNFTPFACDPCWNAPCTFLCRESFKWTKEIIVNSKTLPVLLAVIFSLSQIPVAMAQQVSSSDWAAVQQIQTNAKVVVKRKKGDDIKGQMIEANDSTLTIDHNGKPQSIARADIRQVYVSHGKAEKGKWAAIGAGIGAGAGAGIGAIKYSPDSDDSGIYVVGGLLIGTGVGAVTGLLFGQSRRERTLVYSVM